MNILTGLTGVFNILFGLLIGVSNVMMLNEGLEGPVRTAAVIWAGFGVLLTIVGIGILARQGWARVLGIIVAVLYIALGCIYLFRQGAPSFEERRETIKWSVIAGTTLFQFLSALVLSFGWRRRD
jgi:hypothetical protein